MPRKIYTGKVISDKMDKTVTVAVTRLSQHRRYKKTIKRVSKFNVHDGAGSCKMGDTVRIIESTPFSKTKKWVMLDIIEKA
ncbi:30S ribosomal protein S17 [bacterium BMS3Abin07]|nr:30S ribosomal protein S17 [bacterium BMS3Abin07]GBE33378.1 30S ribosomal protein S17 [bacterium BMS3Bbin05]HDL20440.1 30S ribosomal protein S17 [Nitrospirota bacterium]HDO21929.1 30S ribosomal protein S17 [Nitrospirota bacterium]HDZ87727.1 30S ribosomal protein S17 [Nitrospirota bacterium]